MIDLEAFLQELLIGGAYIEEGRLRVPDCGLSPEKLTLLSEYESEILRLWPTYSFEMPLSYGQEALWVVHQNAPNKAAYNTAVVVHLQSAVDKVLLRDIFEKIGQRHSALRTTIAVRNGEPKQVIHATPALCFEEVDCSGQSWQMVMQAVEEAQQRPFDLSEGPLWRVTLVTQSPDSQALLLSFHHIIFDGWSIWMLVDEFLALAGAAHRAVNLPPIRGTYPQFVQWQRDMLETRGEGLRTYWQEALGGELPVLDLPTEYRRPKVASSQTDSLPFNLSSDLRDQLRALARREGVSFYTVLLAALQILLARYQQDAERVLVGVPTAGREREEFAQTFGYFVNMVVVDATLTDVPFTTFLQQVRAKLLAAIKHRAYPFPWVLKDLQIERDPSRGPIYQASLVVQRPQKLSEETLRLLKGEQVELTSGLLLQFSGWLQTTGELDIMFDLMEHTAPEGVVGYIRYRSDLFGERTIERIGQHYQQLLKAVVSDATQGIYQLPLLTKQERHQLLVEWNEITTDYSSDECIHQLFEQQVERTPEATAVIFGEEKVTYHELNARANQLAHYLIELGTKPDTLVAVAMERSLEMVVSLLAVLKAGGAYVPIDLSYPSERIRYMLTDSAAPILLTQSHLESSAPQDSEYERSMRHVIVVDQVGVIDGQSALNPQTRVKPEDLAYVIYTSGSTGQPKGVMVEHHSLAAHIKTVIDKYQITAADGVLQFASVSFDVSLEQIFVALCSGARLVVRGNKLWTLQEFDHQVLTYGITVSNLPPLYCQQLLQRWQTEPAAFLSRHACMAHQLRLLIVGGEKIQPGLVTLWQQLSLSNMQLLNAYGPTETTITATCFDLSSYQVPSASNNLPIGQPLPNRTVYILNPQLQPTPLGVPGELYIGGVGVARGYLKRPELTAERFIEHPEFGRLYKTGDLCRWLKSGNIEFIGRTDFQVKIRGFRIELGEIESVLLAASGVREAVVLAREDNALRGDKRLVAYVVGDADSDTLRAKIAQRLPDYMIPSAFVPLEAMPLMPNGKIDRRALPAPDFSVDAARKRAEAQLVLPRTPHETILAAIWQEVLGIEQVGIHDNFFEIGGHSLLATQVVSRIRQTLQVELPLRRLFSTPTIAELAEKLTSRAKVNFGEESVLPPLKPVARPLVASPLPLSFAQQRLWFLAQFEGMSNVYNIPVAFRLSGPLDVAALSASWQAICERHEALRTTFPQVDGQPHQQINLSSGKLDLIDLSDLPLYDKTQEAEVARLSLEFAMQPFDLTTGPLWRVTLLRLSEEEHVLLLTMHHIISDGWSINLLMRELSAFYRHATTVLPDSPVQYADFAVWQREWLSGEVLEQQLAYWKAQLADAPPLLTLPTDHPRPAVQSYCGDRLFFTLPDALSKDLKRLSQKNGTTLFMTLQAAFAILLSRYSGQEDILIGTPIANRQVAEVEGLIGFFVNTLVLRNDLSAENGTPPTFRDLLTRVRRVALDAYQHQAVPFELLVDMLQPERSLSHSPLFQVMFSLENYRQEALSIPDITVTPLDLQYPIAKFDLTLFMEQHGESLIASWEYNTDLFDQPTIERMAGHFESLLSGLVDNPDQPIAELPLLTEQERYQLLVEWNDTATDYPFEACIHQLFEQQVARTPEAIAVVFGNQQLTYHELNARANQLAHYLIAQGVGPDVLVGICMPRSIEMVVGLLGILKAGGAYVPLDPSYPQERLQFMLEDAQVPILLTVKQFVHLDSQAVQLLRIDSDWPTIAAASILNPPNQAGPNSLAYVIYTSGSTGRPKGVMVPHRGINRLVNNTNYIEIRASDRMAQASNASFDAATFEIWAALLHGACLVGIPHEVAISPSSLATELQRQEISILFLTTALFNQVVSLAPEAFANLRYLLFGGEAVDPVSVRKLLSYGAPEHFLHVYGPTENTTYSSWYPIQSVAENAMTVPIGIPIANTQIYVLDGQLSPVPVGVPGELYLGGDGLAHGYLKRPKLTDERFIANPFGPGKLYKTGDLCRYLPDGNIEFLGRADYQVKIRGFRIELGEIESALNSQPNVREVVVVVREEGANKRLVAYIVSDIAADVAGLRDKLRQQLPDYMIPSVFVQLEAMPLTPNGKLDRRALPAPEYADVQQAFVAPRNALEQQLADMWADLLGLDKVGIDDNFFALGGHSLLATQLVSHIRRQFNLYIPIKTIFETTSLAELAKVLELSIRYASVARHQTAEVAFNEEDEEF